MAAQEIYTIRTTNPASNINMGVANGTVTVNGNLTVNQAAAIKGNLTITGNVVASNLSGDGHLLTNLSVAAGSSLINGNSNVRVAANSNVTVSVAGNANVVVVTGTGANITGTANITANANVGGNLNVASNLKVTANANVGNIGTASIIATANANVTGNIYLTATASKLVKNTSDGLTGGAAANITRYGSFTTSSVGDLHIASSIYGNATVAKNYGLTFSPASGQTQAGIIISENSGDGTGIGFFATNNYAGGPALRLSVEPAGQLLPGSTNTQDIGSSNLRWGTIYGNQSAIAGTVVQIQNAVSGPARQAIASLTPVAVTGLSISFTPKYANSIIYVRADICGSHTYVNSYGIFKNGSATVSTGAETNSNEPNMQATQYIGTSIGSLIYSVPISYYETSGSTTARTYAVYNTSGWAGGGPYTNYINNRDSNDMASFSYMMVMEIAQ